MAFRRKMKAAVDKSQFRRTASKTKDVNVRPKIMRGGIRL